MFDLTVALPLRLSDFSSIYRLLKLRETKKIETSKRILIDAQRVFSCSFHVFHSSKLENFAELSTRIVLFSLFEVGLSKYL